MAIPGALNIAFQTLICSDELDIIAVTLLNQDEVRPSCHYLLLEEVLMIRLPKRSPRQITRKPTRTSSEGPSMEATLTPTWIRIVYCCHDA